MQIETALLNGNPADAGPLAARLEAMGYDGVYSFEGQHDPFFPLCVAAAHTERMTLTTAIAVAFARNPMLLANIGHDMSLLSRGRFILGLGSQIRPHIERRYSMPWSRPAARMREMVQAIRAIWHSWEHGERLGFEGEFYRHTLMTPFFNPGPNPYQNPPIYIAAVGERMTEMVGEVGDGFIVHPLHSPSYLQAKTLPALRRGGERAGRSAKDCTVSCQVIVATGRDEAEIRKSSEMARSQIAFYSSTPAYKGVLEHHGYDALQPEMNALSKRGEWGAMNERIDDALLNTIAVVGSPEQVAERMVAERGPLAQRLSPVIYPNDDDEMLSAVLDALRRRLAA